MILLFYDQYNLFDSDVKRCESVFSVFRGGVFICCCFFLFLFVCLLFFFLLFFFLFLFLFFFILQGFFLYLGNWHSGHISNGRFIFLKSMSSFRN